MFQSKGMPCLITFESCRTFFCPTQGELPHVIHKVRKERPENGVGMTKKIGTAFDDYAADSLQKTISVYTGPRIKRIIWQGFWDWTFDHLRDLMKKTGKDSLDPTNRDMNTKWRRESKQNPQRLPDETKNVQQANYP